jgi:hypothetical protein
MSETSEAMHILNITSRYFKVVTLFIGNLFRVTLPYLLLIPKIQVRQLSSQAPNYLILVSVLTKKSYTYYNIPARNDICTVE